MNTSSSGSGKKEILRRSARGIGIVSLIFSLVVGVQLAVDSQCADPLQTVRSEELGRTLASARAKGVDEHSLAFARDLDRSARHAYFSSLHFRQAGMWMFAIGMLLGVVGLHLAWRLEQTFHDPRLEPRGDAARSDRYARLAILFTGILAAGAVLVIGLARDRSAPPADNKSAPPPPAVASEHAKLLAPSVQPSHESNAAPVGVSVAGWPSFRGSSAGVALALHPPTAWSGITGSGVVWKVELKKPGCSSPIVGNGHVYLTEANQETRSVLCFDSRDGKLLWCFDVPDAGAGEALGDVTPDTGLAASTPACDALGVYAVFGTGDLVALSPDGKLRWKNYLKRPANQYGHASSLWTGNGLVCVQYDQDQNGRFLALDAATGKTVWEVSRGKGSSWASPVAMQDKSGAWMILANASETLSAYDLAHGAMLWEVEGVTGDVTPSPAVCDGRVYVANAGSRLICYNLALGTPPQKAWEYSDILPDVPSPVAARGLVFMCTSGGDCVCLDALTGKMCWTHSYDAAFYSSPVVCGDCLYAIDRSGIMHVVAADSHFREIATCPMGEDGADATPAFLDGSVFIRTKAHLWRLGVLQ